MRTVTEHERHSTYCPWNGRRGDCSNCMAIIKTDDNEYVCGRLYPPEHFKEETE